MSLDFLSEVIDRRERDAVRFDSLDQDECQLCLARGPDMRTLTLDCLYDIHEVVPEAISLRSVRDDRIRDRGYLLRICKECRACLLAALAAWRDGRATPRDGPR